MNRNVLCLVHDAVVAHPTLPALKWVDGPDSRKPGTLHALSFERVWSLASCASAVLREHIECVASRRAEDFSCLLQESAPLVAVAIDDGPFLPLAELSALLAGAAITPLDPHDPAARLAGLLGDSRPVVVLTKDRGDSKKLQDATEMAHLSAPVFDVSTTLFDLTEKPLPGRDASCELAPPDLVSERLCYVWFTSGSTGKPKGCLVTHGAFANYCGVAKNDSHSVGTDSTVLVATANTFDPSVGDIFASWAAGGAIACAPRLMLFAQLAWLIEKTAATHVNCTPSLWRTLDVTPGCKMLSTLRVLTLGGERMTCEQVKNWSESVRMLNVYGTTECTVWQTVQTMSPELSPSSAGYAMPGNLLGVEARSDGPGEVVIGGAQVGRGYMGRAELTSARFVEMPSLGPGLWYRTGDLGVLRNGCLELLGRADSQVKVRGIRVELGEIELGVASAASDVISVVAVSHEGEQLIAYCQVVSRLAQDLGKPQTSGLTLWEHPVVTEYLLRNSGAKLPRYMLPSRFLLIDKLPITPNGKISVKDLPDAALVKSRQASDGVLTKMEVAVGGIWADVLGIELSTVRAQDHFMELGGTSAHVLVVCRRIRAALLEAGVSEEILEPDGPLAHTLAPQRLFHSPRLTQYAKLMERAGLARWLIQESVVVRREDGQYALDAERGEERSAASAFSLDADHLDHDAWEQVPKTTDDDLLFKAASSGLSSIVLALLSQRADVDGGAPRRQPNQIKKELIGKAPHVRHFLSPLHVAVTNCHLNVVEALLSARANPSVQDRKGSTPLHCAAQRGTGDSASALLQAKARADVFDYTTRSSPLHVAAKCRNLDVLSVLLKGSPQLDTLDRWKRMPLHWGILQGSVEVCEALLAMRAEVEPRLELEENCPKRTRRALDRTYESPLEVATRLYGDGGGKFGDLLRRQVSPVS